MLKNYAVAQTITTYTITPSITEFRGKYAFLSNFFHAPIIYQGRQYANNEAAFQAQKTICARERLKFSMPYLTDPARAKVMGKKLELRTGWEHIKMQYMYEICMSKFLQHADLRAALLATGNCPLMENNTWGDRYWGMVDGFGENHLGLILMDIRGKLKMDYM